MTRFAWIGLWCAVSACGHGSHHGDSYAAVDAPNAIPAPITIEDGYAALAQWTFADAVIGHTSPITLFVRNRDVVTIPLDTAIVSNEFVVDPTSTCVHHDLAPDAICELRLRFTSAAVGTRSATLVLTGGAKTPRVPLTRAGVPPLPGVCASGADGAPGTPVLAVR